MKLTEIRDRTDEELKTLGAQMQEDLFRMRVQKATNQLENTATLRRVRRDLARVNTVQQARAKGLEVSKASKR